MILLAWYATIGFTCRDFLLIPPTPCEVWPKSSTKFITGQYFLVWFICLAATAPTQGGLQNFIYRQDCKIFVDFFPSKQWRFPFRIFQERLGWEESASCSIASTNGRSFAWTDQSGGWGSKLNKLFRKTRLFSNRGRTGSSFRAQTKTFLEILRRLRFMHL